MASNIRKKLAIALDVGVNLFLIFLIFAIGIATFRNDLFTQLIKREALVVVSGSMEPKIPKYSLITVKRVAVEDLKIGDPISFHTSLVPGGSMTIVTHNLADISESDGNYSIRTKPEISDQWDSWVLDETDIIGRVETITPELGLLVLFLHDIALPLLLLLNVIVIVRIILLVRKFQKDKRARKMGQ